MSSICPWAALRFRYRPGRYQITISRGNEYELVQRDLTVKPGQTEEVAVRLENPVKAAGALRGLISMDAGVMTNASSVSTVSARDRVIMAVCEGVSILVSGDYDRATDLQKEIEALGFQKKLKAFMGMRLLVSNKDVLPSCWSTRSRSKSPGS